MNLAKLRVVKLPATTYSDEQLLWAVILTRYQNSWVLVKHKDRNTYELPGGKREFGESIEQCARRELYEETGATDYSLSLNCVYSTSLENSAESFGALYVATVLSFGRKPVNEISDVVFFERLPEDLTYPNVVPEIVTYVSES